MSSEPEQDPETEREIAAALGISGFGRSRGTTRKRQHDKAFTVFNYADFSNDASGCNSIPLGPRRRSDESGAPDSTPEAATAQSSTEHAASPAVAAPTTTPLAAASANHGPGSDPGNPTDPTAGMKASDARKYRKKMKGQANAAGSGLAGFLAMGQKLPDPPIKPSSEPSSTPADSALQASQEIGQPTSHDAMKGVVHSAESGQAASQDAAYFLPSFIEDPWSKLTGNAT